jgi:DNA-binding NarL/FixJ family response regulator
MSVPGPSSSRSTTPPDFTLLSPRSQAIARQIGTRLAEGYSKSEIAAALGISPRSVWLLVSELRDELERLRES